VKVRLVGDRVSVEFFRMAGIAGETPKGPQAISSAIDRFVAEPDVGVVLVASSLAAELGGRFGQYLQRRRLPIVLRIPDRESREGAVSEIRQYLQQTLGVRM